jgi:hypothetical protein
MKKVTDRARRHGLETEYGSSYLRGCGRAFAREPFGLYDRGGGCSPEQLARRA